MMILGQKDGCRKRVQEEPKALQLKDGMRVEHVITCSSEGLREARSTKRQSSWMDWNSVLSCAFNCFTFACTISSREKSKISSDSSLRMCMEFSQSGSERCEAPTRSGMKEGHFAGQSCLRIWQRITSSLLRRVRSRVKVASSVETYMYMF
jgi:hypothetical protein